MPGFPLLGEPLALELANTVVGPPGDETDLLAGGDAAAAAWVRALAQRDAADGDGVAARLAPDAAAAPPSARRLRALRDAIRALVDAAIAGASPDPRALAVVNRASAAAPIRLALAWDGPGAPQAVAAAAPGCDAADATLAAIARSAIALLGGPDAARLRRCDGPGCSLTFVATNPRRRWCSPARCGNRVRVARHYARSRAVSSRSTSSASVSATP